MRTDPAKSQVNYVLWDSTWEAAFAERIEQLARVRGYVKNNGLGFEVPYTFMGEERAYRPDFIVALDDGQPDPLHVVVEIKGFRGPDAEAKRDALMRLWLPAVNNDGRWGRWQAVEIVEPTDMMRASRRRLWPKPTARRRTAVAGATNAFRRAACEASTPSSTKPPSARTTGRSTRPEGEKRCRHDGHAQGAGSAQAGGQPQAQAAAQEHPDAGELRLHGGEGRGAGAPGVSPALFARDAPGALQAQHRSRPAARLARQHYGEGDVQLVWKGKDEEDAAPLTIDAAPIYIQEKVHPKAIIADIRRRQEGAKDWSTTPTRPTCSPTSTASPTSRTSSATTSTTASA